MRADNYRDAAWCREQNDAIFWHKTADCWPPPTFIFKREFLFVNCVTNPRFICLMAILYETTGKRILDTPRTFPLNRFPISSTLLHNKMWVYTKFPIERDSKGAPRTPKAGGLSLHIQTPDHPHRGRYVIQGVAPNPATAALGPNLRKSHSKPWKHILTIPFVANTYYQNQ